MEGTPKPGRFLAGAAKVIITPQLGTRLYGYPTDRFASTIHDDLTATAVAVSNGSETAVLVSATVCSVPEPVCRRVKAQAEAKVGALHMIISATHTHSGPALNSTPGWGEASDAYIEEIFIPRLARVICDAVRNLEDAKLGIGEMETRAGINRRELTEKGTVKLGRNPLGLYDPRMRVITFVSADESRTLGSIIHFGAHGTAAGGPYPDSPVTRDWSGVMTDRIEWMSDAPCAFLNGAEGDVAPRDFNRHKKYGKAPLDNMDQAMEIGGMAATDAAEAYTGIDKYFLPDLRIRTGTITLPYEPLPGIEEIKENLELLKDTTSPMKIYERNHWQKALEAVDKEPETALTYEQVLVQIGPIVFVPHPFEIFTAIAVRLDRFSPVKYTLSLSQANGCNGYLPNKEEIPRGGYEIWSSRYRGAYLLTEDADTELINQNLEIINNMQEV